MLFVRRNLTYIVRMMTLCVLSVFWLADQDPLSITQLVGELEVYAASFLLEPVQCSLKHENLAHDRIRPTMMRWLHVHGLTWKNSYGLYG